MRVTRLSHEETEALKGDLPDWSASPETLRRRFGFPDFTGVSAFVPEVFTLAQRVDHHPELSLSYDWVEVTLETHSAGGVTQNDADLARAIDRVYRAHEAGKQEKRPDAMRGAREAALRTLVYGVLVIGSRAGTELNGMTANWVTQLSFDPCLLGVAIENDAHTRDLIERGRVFTVNAIPFEGGEAFADRFVKPQRRVANKLGDVGFHEGPVTGAPILDQAVAAVECELVTAYVTGDHTFFVGRVVGAETPSGGEPLTLKALGWHYAG